MEMVPLIFLFVGVAVSAAIFALFSYFYPKLAETESNVDTIQKQIERALLPMLYYGIAAAYRTAERAAHDGYRPFTGEDKKAIADGIYDLLPPQVGRLDVNAVKDLISREQFEQMIQDAFNGFDSFYKENQVHFDGEYEVWKQRRRLPARRH